MSTTKNTKKVTKNTTTENTTVFNRYDALYNDLLKCECKMQLVNTMLSYGLYTTTTPTTTLNKNDLYIQFGDKSRLLITAKSLKVYTNDDNASKLKIGDYDMVNDGSYRTKRCTVKNTLENFTTILSYFLTDNRNYLPTTK
jgi:hypothetical protein